MGESMADAGFKVNITIDLAGWLSEHEGVTHGVRTTQRNPTTKLAVPTGR